jgi:hypothetical protein
VLNGFHDCSNKKAARKTTLNTQDNCGKMIERLFNYFATIISQKISWRVRESFCEEMASTRAVGAAARL